MKIGLFVDTSLMCYNTLNYFILNIEKVLQRKGIQTNHITKLDQSVLMEQYDAMIGFNRQEPSVKSGDEKFLLDYFKCPFFNIMVDPPYYHHDSLKFHAGKLHLIFMDQGHVDYYKRYYSPCDSVEMGYLIGAIGDEIPYEKRKIDILFMGSCPDYSHIKEEYITENIFLQLIERGRKQPEQTTEEALVACLQKDLKYISNDDFRLIMAVIGTWSEYYLRGYYREEIIRQLVNAGLNVTLAGNGWERIFPDRPANLTLLGEVDITQTAALTADAKILLNVMPWFKDGLHDRILTAMHNGAVCVTDSSSYIDEHFHDGENIVLYRLNELSKLPDICRYLLEHPAESKAIAEAGKRKAKLEYTWERFVMDYILKWLF